MLRLEKPDLILSDIGMPEKDGYEFIRTIRKLSVAEGGRTPAIALTAFARSEDRTRAMMAGYQVHLSKPVEAQELVATVGSLVGRTGA
jgi:CheY-like chemotaxis protein